VTNYVHTKFKWNETDGDGCRSWSAVDEFWNDYRCVWQNDCGNHLQNGSYFCFPSNFTEGDEYLDLTVFGDQLVIEYFGAGCEVVLDYQLFLHHIDFSNVQCSNVTACEAIGVRCEDDFSFVLPVNFTDPHNCGQFEAVFRNETVTCALTTTAQLVYYEDSCCTQLSGSFPLLSNSNYPRTGANASNCSAEIICESDPTSPECLAIRDGNDFSTFKVADVSADCMDVYIEGKFGPTQVCNTDCVKSSWFEHCYYRLVTPESLPETLPVNSCIPDYDDSYSVNILT